MDHIDVFFVASNDPATPWQDRPDGQPESRRSSTIADEDVEYRRTAGMLVNSTNVERYTRWACARYDQLPWVQSSAKDLTTAREGRKGGRGGVSPDCPGSAPL